MKLVGNLLLVAGTVLGGISAANSMRPWRTLALDDAAPGQFLFEDLMAEGAAEGAEPLAAAGAELTPELVATLRAAGFDAAKVKDPPLDAEEVAIGPGALEAAVGRVLAEDVTLGTVAETVPAGRRLNAALADKLVLAGTPSVRVEVATEVVQVDPKAFAGWIAAEPGTVDPAVLAAEAGAEAGKTLEMLLDGKGTLADALDLTLPDLAEAGDFVDEPLAGRIADTGATSVTVRVPRGFRWGDWSWKWGYLGALLLMVFGIAAKKSQDAGPVAGAGTDEAAQTASPRELFGALEAKVRELAERAGSLDADAIHHAVDPLLHEDCYVLTAGRDALHAALGGARFAEVFGPYATAERRLNRAWSAAVDGHEEEARDALRSAAPEMARAVAALPD